MSHRGDKSQKKRQMPAEVGKFWALALYLLHKVLT